MIGYSWSERIWWYNLSFLWEIFSWINCGSYRFIQDHHEQRSIFRYCLKGEQWAHWTNIWCFRIALKSLIPLDCCTFRFLENLDLEGHLVFRRIIYILWLYAFLRLLIIFLDFNESLVQRGFSYTTSHF